MQLQQKDRGDDHGRYLFSAGGTGDTCTHRRITHHAHTQIRRQQWLYIYFILGSIVGSVCYYDPLCLFVQYCHCRTSYQIDECELADVGYYHVM